MNWGQFRKNVGLRVQIEPPACRIDQNGHVLPETHDDWLVERIDETDVVSIKNLRTDHVAELGKDHIYDFRSNPSRSKTGLKYGFLVLKVQIFLQGNNLWFRPNSRPGERVAPGDQAHHKVQWGSLLKVDANASIPPNAAFATIQYRLWSEEPGVPLLVRIASESNGAMTQEHSGPSGVVEQMITEKQSFYVSLSHPKVRYEINVLGYRWV